jgi:hypothetical protein
MPGSNSHYGVAPTLFLHFVPHFAEKTAQNAGDKVEDKVPAVSAALP